MNRTLIVPLLFLGYAVSGTALADTLSMSSALSADESVRAILPDKGSRQSTVLRNFGHPDKRHAPAGGETPKHPPITRWDYATFSVFFENDHVVDAVVHNQPAEMYGLDELRAK